MFFARTILEFLVPMPLLGAALGATEAVLDLSIIFAGLQLGFSAR